ncbi:hypothetical protein [Streptomyces sp. NPDC047841]|uniref:hypothetical protein n=1 Tax=Streptomyces sp. NPDC047841 TaxID=3154708 RepID=UPI0034565AE1
MQGIPAQARGESAPARHVPVQRPTDDAWAGHPVPFVRAGTVGGEQARYLSDATGRGHGTRTHAERGVDAVSATRRGRPPATTADGTRLAGARSGRLVGEVSWSARHAPGEPGARPEEAGR